MSAAVAPPQGGALNTLETEETALNGNSAASQAEIARDSENEDDDESSGTSFDEEDDDGTGDSPSILSAYRNLLSRRVDLVGDYAGDELFLIEGDSLLLRCFDDSNLDFDVGSQMLHAVYNVEHFLHNLRQRKCHFNIVFFDSNRDLCIPSSARESSASKYHFTRAAIIRHLQTNLPESHSDIQVSVFAAWDSPDFIQYLRSSSPYFLMAHDGAQAIARQGKHVQNDTDTGRPTAQKEALRGMILSFITLGFNVALVNGLEWRDTKVMTMVLEARSRMNLHVATSKYTAGAGKVQPLDISSSLAQVSDLDSTLSNREILAVLVISQLLDSTSQSTSSDKLSLCAAFLSHLALLEELPLLQRRIQLESEQDLSFGNAQAFLEAFCATAERIVQGPSWSASHQRSASCNLIDSIDGRLFYYVQRHNPQLDASAEARFKTLVDIVQALTKINVISGQHDTPEVERTPHRITEVNDSSTSITVLPFSNKVFDKHLESIHIDVDADSASADSLASRHIFQEVTHWHNAKRPLVRKGAPTPQDEKQAFWAAKRTQWQMAEMRTYAASLTNAVGKSLEPETIIVGAPRRNLISSTSASSQPSEASDSGSSATQGKGKAGGKKSGGSGKNAAKNAGKQAMLDQIAATKAKKDESANDKIFGAWQVVCKDIETDRDPRSRYRRAKDYRTGLQPARREILGAETEVYLLDCCLDYYLMACRQKQQTQRIQVVALIWSHARSIASASQLSKSIIDCLDLTVKALKLPPMSFPDSAPLNRKLAFTFALPSKLEIAISLSSKEFQLLEAGPYLERSFDSRPDPRVDFQPDGWQRKVLDTIDADQSVFVVAPTSAGKTFISFYAMKKILEADDDGVLIYVAPTKALVNQIAAEISARYSKSFKYGGKSIWAIHTRDYRINTPTTCQVLVTVPHVLQIMLLAPSNANSWSGRVKRIIFDEIHSIGQAEDGVVWEQLLLMSPCPIVCLSATVGNPGEFGSWLATTQEAIGKKLVSIQHPYRYSDLRKYFYVPPERFSFQGIPDKAAFGSLGLEGLQGFNYVHPVAALVDKSRGIPEDLALESRDCFLLWKAMMKVQSVEYPVPGGLDPAKALPDISRKVDILKWEQALKVLLKEWLQDESSPYDKLLSELETSFRSDDRTPLYSTHTSGDNTSGVRALDNVDDLKKTSLPMLCRLHEQDALPAILFNYDRHQCEKICRAIVENLQHAELTQKKSGPKWEKTLERWAEWKKVKDKTSLKLAQAASKKSAKKSKGDDDDGDNSSKLDMQRDAAGGEDTQFESFDPEDPLEGYHFADHTKVQASELDVYIKQLRWRDIPAWLIEALKRGMGVHHAGMNRKYRQVVEMLFRKGYLRVVVATGTLALGVNMPCKTVVFSGDSVFLTALNYRQCAGRAGRRGFDLLGNVVFQGISRQKVCRLISSRLPDLNGHFPLTTTLVLRLFTLLHGSNNAKYATSAINALLSQPRLYMGGQSFKDMTMHHLRWSIEYLRRQQLLGSDGAPLYFAGLVSHLYFTENASFSFHALLKEGYFHELCAGIAKNEKGTIETLMLVMAHLFNRVYCRQADVEYRETVVKPSSSIVFLPDLPEAASKILRDHNQQTLQLYKAYVESFVEQHLHEPDNRLPLSGMKMGVGKADAGKGIASLAPVRIRSPFVALSGLDDDFSTIHDLCTTVRDGVFLEEAVVPHVTTSPDEMEAPLNAWLLDFFKHGDVKTIERANRVRRADIWFLLNDFSLVLATIVTSLMNFMKLSDGSDMDMLEVMGNLDAHEEKEEDQVAAAEQMSDISMPASVDSGVVLPERTKNITTKKAKNADSWEDLADEEEKIASKQQTHDIDTEIMSESISAWEEQGGEGLKDVLRAFRKLHEEFNIKFKAMWA